MNFDDILDRLPLELAARLESDPFFADIPIVVAAKGNIAAEMARKQAVIQEKNGKSGVAVVVLQIVADDIWEGQPGAPMKLMPAFQVIENVELNSDEDSGTQKSSRKVARHIVTNIKGLMSIEGMVQAIKPSKPCIEPVDLSDLGSKLVGEQVNFECQEFSGEVIKFVQRPVFAGEGSSQLIITCGTPGAAIWYTTDDTWPFPGTKDDFDGSTAQLYTEPIRLDPGNTIVRACAYLDGAVPSPIERKTIITTNQ